MKNYRGGRHRLRDPVYLRLIIVYLARSKVNTFLPVNHVRLGSTFNCAVRNAEKKIVLTQEVLFLRENFMENVSVGPNGDDVHGW